jgi:hypothetical protein
MKNLQYKALLFLATLTVSFMQAGAQTNFIPSGDKGNIILDRLEIKTRLTDLSFSSVKPYMRRNAVRDVEYIDSLYRYDSNYAKQTHLTPVDRENMLHLLMNNSEWSKPNDYFKSKKDVFNALYKFKSNLLEVNNDDLFLSVNPVVLFNGAKEDDNKNILFQNTRGLVARGMIAKRVGFYAYFTENQERDPKYVNNWVDSFDAIPGAGNFKDKTFGDDQVLDYFDARGAVSWNVAKYIDMQFGYDKHFFGNGYRSLLMSDFSNNATFFKINTRIWKFNYQSLFMELYARTGSGGNEYFPRKYSRINYLNINATKWLNLGVFEAIMFGRENMFDIQYMVPVIFLRPSEMNVGSRDNSVVAFDFKANLAKKIQVYGQFMLDELKVKELLDNSKWWGNKQGYQLGVKYIDALGVNNLDIQGEVNLVRPYTYQHFDTIASTAQPISAFVHYNQPFAHPLGANFREFIGLARWQPMRKLYLNATFIHFMQGLDSAGVNMGSWPAYDYNNRPRDPQTNKLIDYGYRIGNGIRATTTILQGVMTYEVFENMFLEATAFLRNFKRADEPEKQRTLTFGLSLRWNLMRRDFMF